MTPFRWSMLAASALVSFMLGMMIASVFLPARAVEARPYEMIESVDEWR